MRDPYYHRGCGCSLGLIPIFLVLLLALAAFFSDSTGFLGAIGAVLAAVFHPMMPCIIILAGIVLLFRIVLR